MILFVDCFCYSCYQQLLQSQLLVNGKFVCCPAVTNLLGSRLKRAHLPLCSQVEDEDQITRIKCNFIISAFGSELKDTQVR
jgi:hypothetical protein